MNRRRRRAMRHWGPAAITMILLGACTQTGAGRATVVETAGTQASGPASPSAGAPGPVRTSPPVADATPLPARFQGTVSPLPQDLLAQMRGSTWHPGCPVPMSSLRLLTLRYWGFDGVVHEGPLVVNAHVAGHVVSVFRRLFAARFPIERMHLAVQYRPGHDDPNDRRDYTAGFNCRPVVTARGPLGAWSQHAYGLAIDINPIRNPYVTSDGYVRSVPARPFRDRALDAIGMIHPGDVVVRAFAAIGWGWGGAWNGDKDYMHFSLTGR